MNSCAVLEYSETRWQSCTPYLFNSWHAGKSQPSPNAPLTSCSLSPSNKLGGYASRSVKLIKTYTWLADKNKEHCLTKEESTMEEKITEKWNKKENWTIMVKKNWRIILEEGHQRLIAHIKAQYLQLLQAFQQSVSWQQAQFCAMFLVFNGFLGPFSILHLFIAHALQMCKCEVEYFDFLLLL